MSGEQLAALAAAVHRDGLARQGVIVAGQGVDDPAAVLEVADRLGWPVLADHRSGCRAPGRAITHFDAMLRSSTFAAGALPEVILRFGEALSSKVLGQWIAGTGADVISVVSGGRWTDPERAAGLVIDAGGVAASLARALPADLVAADDGERWAKADLAAAEAIDAVLAANRSGGGSLTEIDVARATVAAVTPGGALVVSSSMPVRDVEWYGPNRDDITVIANRGANGIDGVVSTAIGVAATGRPTTVLLGDVALLHDSSALVALAGRPVDLDIVVVDNDGGGIFSFLPQATDLDTERFEQLFGTPHGTDIAALADAHGLPVEPWPLSGAPTGVRLTVVETDRAPTLQSTTRSTRRSSTPSPPDSRTLRPWSRRSSPLTTGTSSTASHSPTSPTTVRNRSMGAIRRRCASPFDRPGGAQRLPAPHRRRAVHRARPRSPVERRRLRAADRQRPVAAGRRLGVLLWAAISGSEGKDGYKLHRGRSTADRRSTPPAAADCTFSKCQRLIRFMPKVVIAVVPGWAAGGGHSLHVIVRPHPGQPRSTPVFKQTDTDVASFDGGFGSALLARQVGQKFAREIFFLGRTYTADEAHRPRCRQRRGRPRRARG